MVLELIYEPLNPAPLTGDCELKQFPAVDQRHVIGDESVDGVPTTVVGAFGNRSGAPLWFRFWIDATARLDRPAGDLVL